MSETETPTTSTYIHKFKCLKCGLHFSLYSWEENWTEKHFATCPECKQTQGSFIYWREKTNDFIFQLVPGQAEMLLV